MTRYRKYFPSRAEAFSSLNNSLFDSSFKRLLVLIQAFNHEMIESKLWRWVKRLAGTNTERKKNERMKTIYVCRGYLSVLIFSFQFWLFCFVGYEPYESFCIHHVSVFIPILYSVTSVTLPPCSHSLFFLFSGKSFNRTVQELQWNLYNRWHSLILKNTSLFSY